MLAQASTDGESSGSFGRFVVPGSRRHDPTLTAASRLVDRRAGLWAGVVGPILFIVVFLVEGAIRPGYDPIRHQVCNFR